MSNNKMRYYKVTTEIYVKALNQADAEACAIREDDDAGEWLAAVYETKRVNASEAKEWAE